MAAKGKKAGSLKQGTVRRRLKIPKDKKIPLSKINKELSRLKKMDKDKDKKGVQLGDKNQKYYKALQLSKTLKTTTNVNENYQFKHTSTDYGEIDNSLLAVEYKFTTPSNTYRVEFYSGEYNPEDMIFDLSFGVDSGELNKLDTFQYTGEGNVREIIKTLSNIIEDFFTKHPDVKNVVISGTDDKRKKVYKHLLPKHLSPNTLNKVSINENATYSSKIDYKQQIKDLTKHMIKKGMNILPLPRVIFKHSDTENASQFLGKTAYYSPSDTTIVLYTEGRHPKDIARSFAHEMIHHIQHLEGRLHDIQTTNTNDDDHLNDIEREAYTKGNMVFRNWTDNMDGTEVSSLSEKKKPYKHKSGFDDKLGKDPFGLNQYARELMEEFQIEDIKPAVKSLEKQEEVRIFNPNCGCDKT
jgi:hypothetical protein